MGLRVCLSRILLVSLPLVIFLTALTGARAATPLVIEGLGKGTAAVDGPWQFHTGDDPGWASPTLDDSGWEQITVDKPWGEQGHRSYAGYAWYRKHLRLSPAPSAPPDFSLIVGRVDDVYEVYWNGALVGRYGKMPPGQSYPYTPIAQIFNLGPAFDGVLAVRVWQAPLVSFSTGLDGGFHAAPLVGGATAIADRKTNSEYAWLRSHQYAFALSSFYALVMALSLLAWLRARSQRLLLWMCLYSLSLLLTNFLVGWRLPWSYSFALGALQPVHGLSDVSLWFLLIWLLRLREDRWIVRLAIVLGWIDVTANVLDGALLFIKSTEPHIVQFVSAADAFLTVFETLPEVLPLLLVACALRKKLDAARWLVAIFASVTTLIANLRIALSQGSRYTNWTFGEKITAPLFTIAGNPINIVTLGDTLLLLSIVYAVYRYMRETSARQAAIEQEFKSAQELQRVLVPEELPSLSGYAVTSSYRPAQEVGGDFFQLIALPDGGALLVIGDVSGKGLKAAMTVSLIVGTVRTLAEVSEDPAEVLSGLNRRLLGRLQHGFVTCLALKLEANGGCTFSSAGHLNPYLNDRELDLPAALPLGIDAETFYQTETVMLAAGDRLTLYTDGLLEARNAAGEIFSFDRLRTLVAKRPDAAQASEAAVSFGQEDDVTVITLTRVAAGQESTTSLDAPELVTA